MTSKMRRWLNLFLLMIITIGLISACSSKSSQPSSSLSSSITAECRIIKHAVGESCVPLNPQRIVVLQGAILANAIALGIQPIGTVVDYTPSGIKFPVYLEDKIDNEVVNPIGTEEQPNLEKIALLKPDLILGFSYSLPYDKLSQIAPTVVADWVDAAHWKEFLTLFAEALNKTQEAEQLLAEYDQRIKELQTALGNRREELQVSLAYLGGNTGFVTSDVKGSFPDSILRDVGLQRPPLQNVEDQEDYQINLSLEMIPFMDGDVLFLFSSRSDEANQVWRQLQRSPLWQQLNVVQQNRVYVVDHGTWRGVNILAANAVLDDLFKYLVEENVQ